MKKLLLLQILFISSVIAEEGLERVIDKSKMSACDKAKSKAYASYEIFRMNTVSVKIQTLKSGHVTFILTIFGKKISQTRA